MLDTGEYWEPEGFQLEVVEDLFGPVPEVWMVVPEGNGKTTLMGGVVLYYADFTPSAMCLLGAASRDQCGILLGQAAGFIHRTPGLGKRFKHYKGYRRIDALRTHGQIQVHAADERTGDGVIPGGIVLIDEPHRARDLGLYRTWQGKLWKRDAKMCAISTAGEAGGEFEEVRQRAKDEADEITVVGRHIRAASAGMILHDYALLPDDDPEDLELVKQANPFSGITVETLAAKRESKSMILSHWLRMVCGLATFGEDQWLPDGAWEGCLEDGALIPKHSEVILGVDVATKHDTSAVCRLWKRPDGKVVVEAEVFKPLGDGTAMDLGLVERAVRDNADRFQVRCVVYDKWQFERSAQELRDEGLLMVEHPMSVERMSISSQNFYDAVVSKRIVHGGDRVLAAHVHAGAVKPTERGWRLVKNKAKRPIDALMALTIGFSRVDHRAQSPFVEVIR